MHPRGSNSAAKTATSSANATSMSATEETDLGQTPIIYPEGFIRGVGEDNRNDHEQSGGSGSSSSNTSQTQLVQISLEPIKGDQVVLEKERHPSRSSVGSQSAARKGSEQDPVQEYYCGVGRCRPRWLQRLRDARLFTFLLCCNCFIEGALVSGELL